MINDIAITRSIEKINTYIKQNVKLAGVDEKEDVFEIFDKTQKLFPHWAIMTCPVMHPSIRYVSPNAPGVFGLDKNYLQKHNVKKFFNHIHDADQQDLFDCLDFAQNFLEIIPPEEHSDYRCIYHYRFRKSNNQYIYLHDEKATLNVNESGNLYYSLLRDVTSEKSFQGVKVELFRQDQSLIKIAEHKPSVERTALTKREGELVGLIKQGLSTKEIAWYLKISHNTVRNIKSRMFEKYNVNNTVELLNMTA